MASPWRMQSGGLILGNLLQALVVFAPFMNDIFHTAPFSLSKWIIRWRERAAHGGSTRA